MNEVARFPAMSGILWDRSVTGSVHFVHIYEVEGLGWLPSVQRKWGWRESPGTGTI